MNYLIICFVCVKETSQGNVSFTHPKHMFDREKLIIIIVGGCIFLCLHVPPCNTYFRVFKIKPLVLWTSNL